MTTAKELLKSRLFRGGAALWGGGMVVNLLNYLHRALMGRMLGPEAFGELVALLSLLLIITVPSAPAEITAAKLSSGYITSPRKKGKGLFCHLTLIFGGLGLVTMVLLLLFQEPLGRFLGIDSPNSIRLTALLAGGMLFTGIGKGILQGRKRFAKLSLAIVLEAAVRLAASALLVALGFRLGGALGGILIAITGGYLLTLSFLRDLLKGRGKTPSKKEKKKLWRYLLKSFSVFLLLNGLLNLDKILAKYYLAPGEAGIYAAIASLGQTSFVATSLLAGIFFPIVSTKRAKGEECANSLKNSLLLAILLTTIFSLLFFIFPKPFLALFFGEPYLAGASYLAGYTVTMGAMGLVLLLSFFMMALEEFSFLPILTGGVILKLIFVGNYHESPSQIVIAFLLSLLVTLATIGGLVYRRRRDLLLLVRDKE
jgi:O-antigen/teichoic acid export membrane protein